MAEASSAQSTTTIVETQGAINPQKSPVLKLKLQKPDTDKKVKWKEGTVDNEHMNKKKSKCCCIYEKPKVFGESSSESDGSDSDGDCTNNCRGHKKKCYRKMPDCDHHDPDGSGASSSAPT